jgi:thioredoxin 1
MTEGKPVDVTDQDFDAVLNRADMPVVLEFWSPDCVHCQRMANTMEALAEEYTGEIIVAKVNVLENPLAPAKFGVSGIPAFFYIRGGRILSKTTGAMPKGKLKEQLGLSVIGNA